jgi:hypothetical protein
MKILDWISDLFRQAALRGIRQALDEIGLDADHAPDPLPALQQRMSGALPEPSGNGMARTRKPKE